MKNIDNIALMIQDGVVSEVQCCQSPFLKNIQTNGHIEFVFLQFKDDLDVQIQLTEKGSSCNVKCAYFGAETQKLNINIDITHHAPETKSEQTVKGLLTDSAQASFSGIIRIPYHSQKCEGYQNHRALLLSDNAKSESIPELEIYADNVKCSHGSAIGPLDKSQLFYLLSRGIDEKSAYKILISAFILDLVPQAYQSVVQEWIDEHI